MTGCPKIGIIVLNWNGAADTTECLDSLASVTYADFDIILVDNGSEGDDVRVLRERFGDSVQIVETGRNLGFAGGANVGIRQALSRDAEYVLLLNNDAVVDPAFLENMVQAAESLPNGGAFCPKICHYDRQRVIHSTGGRVNAWTGLARQVGRDAPDNGRLDRAGERDYADGACMLMRRSALLKVGLLDEEYFAYWEETDWCDRAKEAGFKSYYVPSARIWHRGAGSFRDDSRRRFLFRRNAFLFLRKRRRMYHLVSAILYQVLVLVPLYVIRRPREIGRLLAEAKGLLWHLTHRERDEVREGSAREAPMDGQREGREP
jgi:GT2 family glycosyltransferase